MQVYRGMDIGTAKPTAEERARVRHHLIDLVDPSEEFTVAQFQAAYLRAGAMYHDTPMMFYCMPHYPGNTGQHVVQNAVTLWGQNVKDLDFFNSGIDAYGTENYIHSRDGQQVVLKDGYYPLPRSVIDQTRSQLER